jgi:hypothetical protein
MADTIPDFLGFLQFLSKVQQRRFFSEFQIRFWKIRRTGRLIFLASLVGFAT